MVAAGGALQWLAWLTLGYALIVGLLQTQVLSILAYVAVALSAFWVALLGGHCFTHRSGARWPRP